ncbi:unnamed protein product, partial [Boreogadus saida]
RLLNQLNPSLQKLVSLGNSYIQAFYVLATTSEAYFKALARIGEQALCTKSSGSIGRILIQIAENQRKLSTEVEGVFKFHAGVLHEMDHHTQLDQGYISDSRGRYEIEVRRQADALERRRGEAQSECEYLVRRSYSDALQEEERRYRFLAEKHCDVGHAVAQVMNKTGGVSQQRLEVWREELNATRGREVSGGSSRAEHQVSRREEERSPYSEEQQLGRVPSRAPSPSSLKSRSNSLADLTGDGLLGSGGGSTGNGGRSGSGGGRRRTMKAVATHQADPSKPTILGFQRGELVTMLVSQPRNGWLYGQAQNPSRQGWFPAAFVEAVDEPSKAPSSSSGSSMRSSSSMSDLLDQSGGRSVSRGGGVLWQGAVLYDPPPRLLVDAGRELQLLALWIPDDHSSPVVIVEQPALATTHSLENVSALICLLDERSMGRNQNSSQGEPIRSLR